MAKATTNNNPGNLRYAGQQGATNNNGFAQFASPDDGYVALMNDLHGKVTGATSTGLTPTSTMSDLAAKYAPPTENDTDQYVLNLANQLKTSPDTPLSQLQDRVPELASAIAHNEDKDFASKNKLGFNPTPFTKPAPGQFDFSGLSDTTPKPEQQGEQTFGQQMSSRLQQGGQALTEAAQGKINPFSGLLQAGGAAAGAVGDITGDVLNYIPGFKQLTGAIGEGAKSLAGTDIGKQVIGAGQSFAQAHPEAAGNIGAIGNIVTNIPIFKGIGMAKGVIGSALEKAAGKEALSATIDAVAPELTAKTAAKGAAKGGLMKTLISGEIKPVVGQEVKDIASSVKQFVPGFDELPTITDKLNATRNAVYDMAEQLKQQVISSGKDIRYPFKELSAAFNRLEPGIMIKSDAVLQNQFNLAKEAALKFARESGGTISGLFDARKAFDQLVAEQFPNLYERANAPMRNAITSVRGEMNNFIEKKLPAGSGFKESLKHQSRLFKAIDNMAPKAVKTELGTTRASRFAGRHPLMTGLAKNTAKIAGTGVAAGLGLEGAKKVFGD